MNEADLSPAQIAELLEVVSQESDMVDQLTASVDDLRRVQSAKHTLKQVSSVDLKAALLHRHFTRRSGA